MAQQKLSSALGKDFVDMVETLAKKEVEDNYEPFSCYDDLLNDFDSNISQELPGISTLFSKLDNDLKKLEEDSNVLDKELVKLLKDNSLSTDNISLPVKTSDYTATFTDTSHSSSNCDIQKYTRYSSQQSRLKELRNHTCNGRISSAALRIGVTVLGLCKDEWKEGVIEDILKHRDKIKYKVRFTDIKRKSLLPINHIACCETYHLFMNGQIPVGSRIAASFKEEGIYSGVIAETADSRANKGRYLIFYDDGYTMYCAFKAVYLVYGYHIDVWNDIPHKNMSDFVKDYLSVTERQLLSLKEGQILKVEFDGEWHRARCNKVDCSLVEILYQSDNSTEWIYRGSRRLEPLHLQYQLQSSNEKTSKIARAHTGMRRARIEFVDLTEDTGSLPSCDSSLVERKEDLWIAPWARSRSEQKAGTYQAAPTQIPNSFTELTGGYDIASKIQNKFEQKSVQQPAHSTSQKMSSLKVSNKSKMKMHEDEVDDGIDIDSGFEICKKSSYYTSHSCSVQCMAGCKSLVKNLNGVNPLTKPLLCGWSREICRIKPCSPRTSFHVCYRTPCGRACRSMSDVEQFLNVCKVVNLDYDHFCFDHTVRTIVGSSSNVRAVKKPQDAKYFEPDYSKGKEDVPISCVNEISYEEPPKMPYTKSRVPGKDVYINTSPEYMVCCDCTDNCRDRSKCACQQLTVQATSCSHGGKVKNEAGYQYKRLFSFLPTGIYECNSRCKCNIQCKNRVVQKGLQCRLQMFKTQKKGWGIRCIDDIAQGTFVCIYTGRIETESNANSAGLLNGDEYLAELDHIEVAENQKDDYNSDNSSGFDSQGNSSDEEGSNSDKQCREQEDSTDTDDETDVLATRDLGPVTFIGGHKRKLGYAVGSITHPLTMPDGFHHSRKPMIMKKNVEKVSSTSSYSSTSRTCEDDTTDTDSDTDVVLSRPPTARKSTSGNTHWKDKRLDTSSQTQEDLVGTRRFFGSEGTYIIDAKQTGNLGRYLNHSCTPNLMVQNVFIDTHDLRFPWVAFFASNTIRSGTELTWDYNYEIGSVPERVIHCYCGSTKCRKRLL